MPSKTEKLTFIKTELLKKSEIQPGVFVHSFKKNFSFVAGQCVAIKYELSEEYRIYSIASGENTEYIDILFDVNPEGLLTPRLASLKIGQSVYISNPFGNFFTPVGESWWIAAGTGIAPFMAMARSGFANGKTLIHGAPTKKDFYFSEDLSISMGHYVRCCSREKVDGTWHGRVTSWLADHPALPVDIPFLICGSAEFVVDVRDVLLEKGIKFDKIIAEIYF